MAVDYFLKIEGIEGESQDKTHKGEIELLSFNWGGTQTSSVATGSGSGAGRVNLSDFSVAKHYDKASPKLFLAMATGQHFKSGTLTARKAGKDQQEYLKVTLTDLFVTSNLHSTPSAAPSCLSCCFLPVSTTVRRSSWICWRERMPRPPREPCFIGARCMQSAQGRVCLPTMRRLP